MSSLMTPEHPRWQEFLNCLMGEDGCNWIHVPADEVKADGTVVNNDIDWDFPALPGNGDLDICRSIFERMGDIDVEGSLEYFRGFDVANDAEVASLQFLIDMQAPSSP